jgi:hypothetical protein
MPAINLSNRTKKIGVILGTILVLAVIIVSALVLVNSAKLRTGTAPKPDAATASTLTVNSSPSESPFSATSDTSASATLQGASSSAEDANNGGLSNSNPVSVKRVLSSTTRACDQTAQEKLEEDYDTKKNSEDAYHKSLMGMLQSEGILLVNSEDTRHENVLAKLKTTLNNGLAEIACPTSK